MSCSGLARLTACKSSSCGIGWQWAHSRSCLLKLSGNSRQHSRLKEKRGNRLSENQRFPHPAPSLTQKEH